MRYTLNWKLLIVLLVVVGALGVGVHFLHAYQVDRNARALRERATAAVQAGDAEKARQALTRYLTYVPADADALADYGKVLREQGNAPLALKAFQQVVDLDPKRRDARRQVVELALAAEQYATAAAHARKLIDELPKDATEEQQAERGDLQRILGQCHEARKRFTEAVEAYGFAASYAPQQLEAFLRRAELLRDKLQQPQQADTVMSNMVRANPSSFRAYVERGRYRQRWQQPGAEEDLDRARVLARENEPQDVDDLLAAAELVYSDNDLNEARKLLTRALERFPGDRRIYHRLARLELQAGKAEDGVAVLQKGLTVFAGDRELRVRLVEALLAAGKSDEATAELDALRKEKAVAPVLLEYLDAHVLLRNKQWADAAQLLERIREQLAPAPDLRGEADHALGLCYERLGDRDQYLATLQRAIGDAAKAGSRTSAARYRLGTALFAAGRVDEALGEFAQAALSQNAPPQTYLRLAEATLARVARLPAELRKQQYVDAEEYLKVADQLLPDNAEVALVRSQGLTAQNRFDEAEAVLRKAREKHPKKTELWTGHLALLLRRGGDPAAARAVLDEAQAQLGDTVELRLLRAQFWANRPDAEARTSLAALAKEAEQFTGEERPRLLAGVAEALFRVGEIAEADKLWRLYLEVQPKDLRVRQVLFELAQQANDEAAMTKELADLKAVEGPDGVYWRSCAVVRLLGQSRRVGGAEHANEIRQLLAEIKTRRPKWSRTLLMEGELAELEGKHEEAVGHYLLAIDQGERSLRLIQRTVELLNQTKQYRLVDQLIAKLGESAPVSEALRWLTVDASLRGNDLERAEIVARAAVLANPEDYRQHLLLGQVLGAAGKGEEAEKVLRHAVGLAEQVPENWIALVQQQIRIDPKRALETVEQARAKLPADKAPFALGPCLELLGKREEAEKEYEAALAAKPDDAALLRVVALFHTRAGQQAKADTLLRRILTPNVNASEGLTAWARRTLALHTAGREYRQVQEALLWLEENIRRAGNSPADQRVKVLLLDRPGRRHEAIKIMEELVKTGTPAPADRFVLARLYEGVGDWARADTIFGSLAAAGADAPVLAHYARGLLRRGETDKARSVTARLEKLDPQGPAPRELAARLLHAEGQTDKAVGVLQAIIQDAKDASTVGITAVLLEEMGQAAPAEAAYRLFVEQAKTPESVLSLARFLGRQGRVQESLDLCEQAAAAQLPPAAIAAVMAAIARAGKADQELGQRVERWITAALNEGTQAKDPRTPALLSPLADLYDYQGRYGEAAQLYRKLLAVNPNDHVAANNLAWLVAMQDRKRVAEVLPLMNNAIDKVTGPVPALLDTRATVYQALGRSAEAIQDLQVALSETQTPTRWFHLALAYRQAQKQPEAKDALQMAKTLGLDAGNLHPLEQPAYKALVAELGMEK